MKITKILMMLLFTSAIFVSCGPDAAADGKKYGELMCEAQNVKDMDEMQKLMKEAQDFGKEMTEKWEGEDADEKDAKAFREAYEKAMEDCKK